MIVCRIGDLRVKEITPGSTTLGALRSAHDHAMSAKQLTSYLRRACIASSPEDAIKILLERLRGLISITEHGKEVVALLEVSFEFTPVYDGGLFDEDFMTVGPKYHSIA